MKDIEARHFLLARLKTKKKGGIAAFHRVLPPAGLDLWGGGEGAIEALSWLAGVDLRRGDSRKRVKTYK